MESEGYGEVKFGLNLFWWGGSVFVDELTSTETENHLLMEGEPHHPLELPVTAPDGLQR